MKIAIDDRIHQFAPDLALGVLTATVKVTPHQPDLWRAIGAVTADVRSGLTTDLVSGLPEIAAMRELYRSLGADPNRYRGSAEALLRRLTQGKDLYQVNTVVDINNLTSLASRHPVGSYDLDCVRGPVVFRLGCAGEVYRGIGKREVCLDGLPLFADGDGPFGSPTSDSERTMIRPDTSRISVVVIAACEGGSLRARLADLAGLLDRYAEATDMVAEISLRDV